MKLDIAARHFALTDSIREYTERRFDTLGHLNARISSVHVVLDHDDHHSARQYLVKAHLDIPGDSANAEVRSADLYEGVDLAVEKLAAQLRKVHDRQNSRRANAEVADFGVPALVAE